MTDLLLSEWRAKLPSLAERWGAAVEDDSLMFWSPLGDLVPCHASIELGLAPGTLNLDERYMILRALASVQTTGGLLECIGVVEAGRDVMARAAGAFAEVGRWRIWVGDCPCGSCSGRGNDRGVLCGRCGGTGRRCEPAGVEP